MRVEIQEQVSGTWIAVPRLTDGTGVEERPRAVQLELRVGRGHAAVEPITGLNDAQCDVAVPDEDERRVCELERRARRLVAEHVLPDRVARRAVVELDTVSGSRRLERFEERLRLRLQHFPGPPGRDCRLAAELLQIDRAPYGQVVVPRETDVGPLRDQGATLVRPGPVADEVAETPELVRRLRLDRREDRLQRVQVRVDVGDDCDAHRQRRTLTRRERAPSLRPPT